jgi:hypothetical protein
MSMNLTVALAAASVVTLVTGCTGGASAPAPRSPVPTQPTTATLSATEQRMVDVYDALLERQSALEPNTFRHVFVQEVVNGEPLPAPVQRAITEHFPGPVRVHWYLQHIFTPQDHVTTVALPTLPAGDQFRVVVRDSCGNVCGHGQRYTVRLRDGSWTAAPAPVGPTAVS